MGLADRKSFGSAITGKQITVFRLIEKQLTFKNAFCICKTGKNCMPD
jgi:hypothetical protein